MCPRMRIRPRHMVLPAKFGNTVGRMEPEGRYGNLPYGFGRPEFGKSGGATPKPATGTTNGNER